MKKEFLFLTPLFYSIGNASEDILYGFWRAKLQKRRLVVIKPYSWTQILGYSICNHELFNLLTLDDDQQNESFYDLIRIELVRLFINIQFVFMRIISLLSKKIFKYSLGDKWNFPQIGWNSLCKNIQFHTISDIRSDLFFRGEINVDLNLTTSTALNCAYKINLTDLTNPNGKFICLHVRESGFHNDHKKRVYRNADITNYLPSIEYLLRQGLTVYRMGDKTMSKLPINDRNFIDYPFTDLKSNAMDLYLIKNCEYFIGMSSGIYDTALLFNKPCLLLNNYSWFTGFPFKKCDRSLLKKIILPSGFTANNLSEIVKLPYESFDYTANLKENKVIYKENSPNEIMFAVTTFHDDYLSGFSNKMNLNLKYNYYLYRKFSDKILNDSRHSFFYNDENANISRIVYRNLLCRGSVYDI